MLRDMNEGPETTRSLWVAATLLLVVSLLAYSPALQAGFNVDDDLLILDNPQMMDAQGLVRTWTSADQWDYWPLTYTAYWAQRQMWGLDPLPFHLANILLHAVNAWLLFFLLRRLAIPAAWLAAGIFALHPIMVESVAWIAELKNLLSGFFLLLAAHAFLRNEESPSRKAYLASLVFFLAALLSKTSTVMLPPALLLLCWWKRGDLRARDGLRLLPHFGLSLAFGLVTIWFAFFRSGANEAPLEAGFAERIAIAGKSFWFYWGQFFAPQPSFHYPRWNESAAAVDFLPALAAATLFVALLWARKSWGRPWLLGLGVYALMLFPVLGFVGTAFFRISFVADHFAYLPMLGMAPLFASALGEALRRLKIEKAFVPLGLGLLAAAGAASWNSSQRFHDKETLWKATLKTNPQSWFAHLGLALVETDRRNLDEAERHCKETLRLNPKALAAKSNLGGIQKERGHLEEAERLWKEVLSEEPENAPAHYNLARLRMAEGKFGEAIAHLRRAAAARPIWATARSQLGAALAQLEKWDDAEKAFRDALRLNPYRASSHAGLGDVLFAQGKNAEALPLFQTAADLDPGLAEAWWGMARALRALGKPAQARWPAMRAAELARVAGNEALAEAIRGWIADSLDAPAK